MKPEMMSGTQGTPDFFVMGEGKMYGDEVKVGFRPLFMVSGGGGKFRIFLRARVRYQGKNGTLDIGALKSNLTAKTGKYASGSQKAVPTYGSYMMDYTIDGQVDDTAHTAIAAAKFACHEMVESAIDHAIGSGMKEAASKSQVISWLLVKLEEACASVGMDIGDLGDLTTAPKDQPFVKKYGQQGSAPKTPSASQPTAKKKTQTPDPTPNPTPAPDKYAEKKVEDEDLSDLNFDELMKKIGKQ